MRERTGVADTSATEITAAPATPSTFAGAAGSSAPSGRSTGTPPPHPARELMAPEAIAYGFLQDCDRSVRYHAARRAFFDIWHHWMMVGVLVSGSAAVASLSGIFGLDEVWTALLMLGPTSVGAVQLVWGLTHKARDHEILARRWLDLAKRIRVEEANPESIREWRSEMMGIHADEPPVYHAVNAECHNATVQAVGAGSEHAQRISGWRRALRHWLRFSTTDFPLQGDA